MNEDLNNQAPAPVPAPETPAVPAPAPAAPAQPAAPAPAPAQPAAPAPMPQQPYGGQPPVPPQPGNPYGAPMPPMPPAPQPSSTPMVLGIIALVASLFIFPIGLVLGIVAVVMAGKQIKQYGPVVGQKARTGKICGIVAIVISTIALLVTIAAVAIFGVALNAVLEEEAGSGSSISQITGNPSVGDADEAEAEAAAEAAFDEDLAALMTGGNPALIDTVQDMMEDIDEDAGPDDLSFSLMGITAQQIVDAMAATATYEITELDYIASENKVWVTANVTLANLVTQIDEFDRLYMADSRQFENAAEAGAAFGELYLDAFATAPTVTVEVMAEYYLTDGEWKLLDSDWEYLADNIAYSTGE